jgi:hypothetical protein
MGKRIKYLCSDGGGEYMGHLLQRYLNEQGIQHELTTPYTPEHNGVAECMNWTLLDKVQAMLAGADLPETYWFEALQYAALLHNIMPTWALNDMMLEEAWSRNKPDVSRLHVFGSCAFVHVPKKHRPKLAARSLICTFLSFAHNQKAYRLVHRKTRRFIESCDIIFDEGGPSKRYERIVIDSDELHPAAGGIRDPESPN